MRVEGGRWVRGVVMGREGGRGWVRGVVMGREGGGERCSDGEGGRG